MPGCQGLAVGSVIRMGGYFLGLSLVVVEVVTERTPPAHKTWETRGPQKLLIIDSYVMGFETRDVTGRTRTRVFSDYRLPSSLPGPLGRYAVRGVLLPVVRFAHA